MPLRWLTRLSRPSVKASTSLGFVPTRTFVTTKAVKSATDGGNGTKPSSPPVFCLSSWFCLPEQGMTTYDVLGRASAFLYPPSNAASAHRKFHVIGSGHVTHPHRFPVYYPRDQLPWLDFVRDDAIQCKLEARDPTTGALLQAFSLDPYAFVHPTLDLVVLHLDDEDAFEEALAQMGHAGRSRTMVQLGEQLSPVVGERLSFQGNELVDETAVGQGADDLQLYRKEYGTVTARMSKVNPNDPRVFAKTPTPLLMGLCGGPVLDAVDDTFKGVVEGVVSAPSGSNAAPVDGSSSSSGVVGDVNDDKESPAVKLQRTLAGSAVFIDGSAVQSWVNSVETEMGIV